MPISRRPSRKSAYRRATAWPATAEQVAKITAPTNSRELATQTLLDAFGARRAAASPVWLADRKRHLVCFPYGLPELHAMAAELGLGRRWFHADARHPHYDIPKDREAEILARCVVVRPREILAVIKGGAWPPSGAPPPGGPPPGSADPQSV